MTRTTSAAAFSACLVLAAGAGLAGAQTPPKAPPAARAAPSGQSADDAMTDVDPAVVAQCRAEADRKG